jgi:predicted Zn-dependent peptidase
MLDIGSRDEQAHQQGLAHFWEHMAFKGTQKRSALDILNSLESVGGELNAYTTKEKVCFHASVLSPYTERAVALLTDITFHSEFPSKQVEREKEVILEEMAMYQDTPEDAIQDDFDEIIYNTHQLGRNILGNTQSVKNFEKSDLQAFIYENLDTSRIVFASTGNMPIAKMAKLIGKYIAEIPAKSTSRKRSSPGIYQPQNKVIQKPIQQAHVAIGRTSYALHHHNRVPFFMLVNLLGGPAMNSRFNLSLREKNGLVYAIDANYTPYIDTGFVGVYFGTEKNKVAKSRKLIYQEFDKVRNKALSGNQLHILKNQLKGQLAMAEESNMGFMQMMAKSLLDMDKIDSLDEVFEQINVVTASHIQDIAQEMFDPEQLSSLTFMPEN